MSQVKYQTIQRVSVSGLSHNDYAQHAKEITVGDELILVRDPTNRFDDKAVKVLFNGDQIAWVPKEKNEVVAKLLEHEFDVRAWVISHDSTQPLDRRLYVGIALAQSVE